jgi:hypothetical protein
MSEKAAWNRYSILVMRRGKAPQIYRTPNGAAAWAKAHATRRAHFLGRRKDIEWVKVVPAQDEDVACWQKTPMANRGLLPKIEGVPKEKKARELWIARASLPK